MTLKAREVSADLTNGAHTERASRLLSLQVAPQRLRRNPNLRPSGFRVRCALFSDRPPYEEPATHTLDTAQRLHGRSFLALASRNVPSIDQAVILSPSCLPHTHSVPCSGLPRAVLRPAQQGHRRSARQAD